MADAKQRRRDTADLLGVVNLDKPVGWTSAAAVTFIRKLLGLPVRSPVNVGHAGALDPKATGVLVVLVGRATRLAELLMDAGKEYVAEIRLGATSTTDDTEGEITPTAVEGQTPRGGERGNAASATPDSSPAPDEPAVRETLNRFVGEIQQRPPAHSAVHVAGRRAYHLARRGAEPSLPSRPVHIHELELLAYDWPMLRLRIACGRGVYVRSLARDIGQALGVGGYVADLRRTRVGPFDIETGISPDACRPRSVGEWLAPVERVVALLPRLDLTESQTALVSFGTPVESAGSPAPEGPTLLAAFDPRGRLVALCRPADGRLRPAIVIRPGEK